MAPAPQGRVDTGEDEAPLPARAVGERGVARGSDGVAGPRRFDDLEPRGVALRLAVALAALRPPRHPPPVVVVPLERRDAALEGRVLRVPDSGDDLDDGLGRSPRVLRGGHAVAPVGELLGLALRHGLVRPLRRVEPLELREDQHRRRVPASKEADVSRSSSSAHAWDERPPLGAERARTPSSRRSRLFHSTRMVK